MKNCAWLTMGSAYALAASLLPSSAHAQNAAASESLFQRGVSEMLNGRYATACPALQESYMLEPRAGTKFTLADCEAKWGHIATALAHYSDYLGLVDTMPLEQRQRHAERATVARNHIEALRARVPLVVLKLPEDAPEGTVVTRDGVALSRVSLGIEIPIDPGAHVVTTQVPNGPKHEVTFRVDPGEHKQIQLELVPAANAPAARSTKAAGSAPIFAAPKGSRSNTWAYVAGGVGVVGIAAGAVTGLLSMKEKKIVDANCVASTCNPEGMEAAESGRHLATASTLGFGLGLVGVATGAVLWLTAPRADAQDRGRQGWSLMIGGDAKTSAVLGIKGKW